MLVFILSLLFESHPDFWLPDEKIETPLSRFLTMHVENLRKGLARDYTAHR